jgi:hypothetical protein
MGPRYGILSFIPITNNNQYGSNTMNRWVSTMFAARYAHGRCQEKIKKHKRVAGTAVGENTNA